MIKQDYAQRIAQASESDKSRLADEGKQALTKAVTDQGLSVGEYTAIMPGRAKRSGRREKILQRIK